MDSERNRVAFRLQGVAKEVLEYDELLRSEDLDPDARAVIEQAFREHAVGLAEVTRDFVEVITRDDGRDYLFDYTRKFLKDYNRTHGRLIP